MWNRRIRLACCVGGALLGVAWIPFALRDGVSAISIVAVGSTIVMGNLTIMIYVVGERA